MRRDDENVQLASRGANARQVIENPAFIEAMQAMHRDVIDAWKQCPIRDAEGQRLLLQLMRVTEKFERTLIDYVSAGHMAQAKLDELNELRDESRARKVLRKVL